MSINHELCDVCGKKANNKVDVGNNNKVLSFVVCNKRSCYDLKLDETKQKLVEKTIPEEWYEFQDIVEGSKRTNDDRSAQIKDTNISRSRRTDKMKTRSKSSNNRRNRTSNDADFDDNTEEEEEEEREGSSSTVVVKRSLKEYIFSNNGEKLLKLDVIPSQAVPYDNTLNVNWKFNTSKFVLYDTVRLEGQDPDRLNPSINGQASFDIDGYLAFIVKDALKFNENPMWHLDCMYLTVSMNIPNSFSNEFISSMWRNIIVNRERRFVTVGCSFKGMGVCVLATLKQMIMGDLSPSIALMQLQFRLATAWKEYKDYLDTDDSDRLVITDTLEAYLLGN